MCEIGDLRLYLLLLYLLLKGFLVLQVNATTPKMISTQLFMSLLTLDIAIEWWNAYLS